MMYIDAREGVSGDMLAAAMLGLLEQHERDRTTKGLRGAAVAHGLEFILHSIEDSGDKGLALSYRELAPVARRESSYDQCFSLLADMEEHIGFSSPTASAILQLIFEAEGEAHGMPPEEVHLHEIGRPQAILNIAALGFLSWRLIELGAGTFVCSTIITGKGVISMSHGAVKVPPPASEALLKNMTHAPGDAPGERATPTGIAALKAIIRYQSDDVPSTYQGRSVGFGAKSFGSRLGRTILLWV